MKNNLSTWTHLAEALNKLERIPSDNAWVRIQQKNFRHKLIRFSYRSVAASILIVVGVLSFMNDNSRSYSGYHYEPTLKKEEAESFLAAITFSNTYLLRVGKVTEGNENKLLIPKHP